MIHRPDIHKYITEKFKLFIIVVHISRGHYYTVEKNDWQQNLEEQDTKENRESLAISP